MVTPTSLETDKSGNAKSGNTSDKSGNVVTSLETQMYKSGNTNGKVWKHERTSLETQIGQVWKHKCTVKSGYNDCGYSDNTCYSDFFDLFLATAHRIKENLGIQRQNLSDTTTSTDSPLKRHFCTEKDIVTL